jgi:small subunit ribosomal protein S2
MPRKKKTESEEEAPEETETKKKATKAEESEKEDKLAKLKAKAKKLAEAVQTSEIDVKKVKGEEEKKDTLVPIEDYLKSSIHLGTRAITPDMRPFVYKRRADSLAVFNTTLLDEKIKEGAEYLSKFAPNEIIVVCKREAGHKAAELFAQATGIRVFTKKYPAGILTNSNLDTFLEADLMLICDPWTDKNALNDAKRVKMPVM